MDNLIAQHSASLAPHQLPTGPLILGAFYASLRYSSHTALKLRQNLWRSTQKEVTLKSCQERILSSTPGISALFFSTLSFFPYPLPLLSPQLPPWSKNRGDRMGLARYVWRWKIRFASPVQSSGTSSLLAPNPIGASPTWPLPPCARLCDLGA